VTLEDWVRRDGVVVNSEFLRVDGFLNHRIDPAFVEEAGRRLAERFAEDDATCVLTAEAAGNVIAYETARRLGVRALYAKKGRASTMSRPYSRLIVSPTKGTETELAISRDYLTPDARVLIVDDFLFEGRTSAALAEMVMESGASLVGFGFVIAKEFAGGRCLLEAYGVPLVTLVSIESMDPQTGRVAFREAA